MRKLLNREKWDGTHTWANQKALVPLLPQSGQRSGNTGSLEDDAIVLAVAVANGLALRVGVHDGGDALFEFFETEAALRLDRTGRRGLGLLGLAGFAKHGKLLVGKR